MRSRDINIYTFWIDLDVLCSIFKKIWRGLGDSGSYGLKVQLQTKGRLPGERWTGLVCGPGGAEISEIEKAHGSNGGERRNVIPFHFFW